MIKYVVLILAFALLGKNSQALCFHINEQVRSNYSQSEAVFVAKVVGKRIWDSEMPVREGDETNKGDEVGTIFYKIKIDQVIKGTVPSEFEVKTENSSGRVLLNDGETYLLFADRLELKDGGKSKFYWLNSYGCLNPEDFSLPKAKDKILEVADAKRAAQNHELAKVGVRVLTDPYENLGPIAGKHFVLKGIGIQKAGVTSKDGWLWFEVPAGHYSVASMDKYVEEQVFAERIFSFEVVEGGGWDCVFVWKGPRF